MDTTPVWLARGLPVRYPILEGEVAVDVLVVGGGITGVTAAYLLKKAGKRVALVERSVIGQGETGHTTAHITYVTDERLHTLVKDFGKDHAQAAWQAGESAMEQIFANVAAEGIECGLRHVPGFLFAARDGDVERESELLKSEAEQAREMGFDAAFVGGAPLVGQPAIRFANQACFHPIDYIRQLAERIPGDGSHVFENTETVEFDSSSRSAKSVGGVIRFERCVIATHAPIHGLSSILAATLRQTKLAAYSSYAIGGMVSEECPEALFWDTADPYRYLRIDRAMSETYAIFGGEDHKTGQDSARQSFVKLWDEARQYVSSIRLDHRWTGQVIETTDGLPYIGETTPGEFLCTGYAGNGMTFGTIAAVMALDWVLGSANPWTKLFAVDRKKLSAAWDYLLENKDYPYYLAKSRLAKADTDTLADVPPGSGCIVMVNGKKATAYRAPDGSVTICSAVCPHMGCVVRWNGAEQTWDCPCHGSRFHATGEVRTGPAEKPLQRISG